MAILQLPLAYLLWHYASAWGDLARLYRNLAWFLWNFFSISLLSHTLFSPWRRLREGAQKDTGGWVGGLIVNTILRFVGLGARLVTILFGLASVALLTVGFIAFFALWPLLPFIAPALILVGLFGLSSF